VDPRADLYSVGAVAYFLLTGTRVFDGATVVEICSHHLHTPPEPPSQRVDRSLAADLEAWVLGCLEKKPSLRPPSAAAAAEALSQCGPFDDWDVERAREWWAGRGRELIEAGRARVEPSVATLSMPVGRLDRS
jgi:serine/threonine-protein kinase